MCVDRDFFFYFEFVLARLSFEIKTRELLRENLFQIEDILVVLQSIFRTTYITTVMAESSRARLGV